MPDLDQRQLRKLAFEVSVLADRDFLADDYGVHLSPLAQHGQSQPGPTVSLRWDIAAQALAYLPDETSQPELRHTLLRLIDQVDLLAGAGPEEITRRARPYALPRNSPLHPGPRWVCQEVLGGALDVGLAFALASQPAPTSVDHLTSLGDTSASDPTEAVQMCSPFALLTLGYDPKWLWSKAQRYLQAMGQAAAAKVHNLPAIRITTSGRAQAVLRPSGDVDVLTLLADRDYRHALAEHDHSGLCAVAVPMRRRGWIDLSVLDPAFIPTAYELTDLADRGFPRPVLVTADEVVYHGR